MVRAVHRGHAQVFLLELGELGCRAGPLHDLVKLGGAEDAVLLKAANLRLDLLELALHAVHDRHVEGHHLRQRASVRFLEIREFALEFRISVCAAVRSAPAGRSRRSPPLRARPSVFLEKRGSQRSATCWAVAGIVAVESDPEPCNEVHRLAAWSCTRVVTMFDADVPRMRATSSPTDSSPLSFGIHVELVQPGFQVVPDVTIWRSEPDVLVGVVGQRRRARARRRSAPRGRCGTRRRAVDVRQPQPADRDEQDGTATFRNSGSRRRIAFR
jgi:hypothetical protein